MSWQVTPDLVRLQADNGTGTWPLTIGKVRTVQIARGEAEPGVIRLEVYDVTLDVTTSAALRTGKPVRFQVDNGAGGWKTICEGKVTDPVVDYDPRPGAAVPVNVKVETTDLLTKLQNTPENRGVGTIEGLRRLLTGTGIPFVINGSSATDPADPDIVATNDNASLWDQILVTRDSVLGYAWVDMENKLRIYDQASMPGASVASLTRAVYSDIDIDWSPDQLINTVTVQWRRYDIGTETAADVPYGPYIDQPSIDSWGERSATFTAQGETEDEVAIAAYGQEILDRNSTAEIRPRTVTIPIREAADLVYARNIDLNSRVTVTYPDGVTTKVMRVVGIDHAIAPWDPARSDALSWLMTVTLALPDGVAFPSQTPGTGIPYVPPDSIGGDELEDGSVDLDKLTFDVTDQFGIRTFAQAAAPAIPPAKAGDLWIDIDDKFRLYRCNGATWTDARDLTIQDALNNADLAMTTANGKSTVHHSTNPPGATANRAGDIWFQYAANIIIGQWRGLGGTSWQAETVGNTVIANLDAGKITTGFLDANRIAAGSIGTNHLAAGSVTAGTIAAGAIIASKIAAGALDGKTITGSIIQSTTTPNRGTHIDTDGVRIYRNDGVNPLVFFNTALGSIIYGENVEFQERVDLEDQVFATGLSTVSASPNVYLSSGNELCKITSSRRYKKSIEDLDLDLDAVLKLRPRSFARRDEDTGHRYAGLIAEEVHNLGLTQFVDYDEKGRPDGVGYALLAVAQQLVIQRQEDRINRLEERLTALEERSTP